MHEESVEAVGYSLMGLRSKDWLAVHGLGIPHDEFGLLSSAVIYERHEIPIIFRLCVISPVIKHFSSTFGITKIDPVDNHLFFKIVLDDGFEVAVVLADLRFRDDALETNQISEFCLIADKVLFNDRKFHMSMLLDFPLSLTRR